MNTELLLVLGIVGFVFLLLNIIFLGILFFMRRKMAAVSQWPSTMGSVIMSTLDRRSSDDGYTDYPLVQYSYQVGGQTYQGMKIAPGPEVGGTGQEKWWRATRPARRSWYSTTPTTPRRRCCRQRPPRSGSCG